MKPSAGLQLSVGHASLGVRVLLAIVIAAAAALCLGGGVLIARAAVAARILAIALVMPFGVIGAIAVPFILAPWSRFGLWLDAFVPRLREPRIALGTVAVLWTISFLVTRIAV